MKKHIFSFFICCIMLSGCYTNNFKDYYNELVDEDFVPETVSPENFVKVIETSDPSYILEKYAKEGYTVIGESSFNGEWEPLSNALETAVAKSATIVIVSSSVIGNIQKDYAIPVNNFNTAYHSGNVSTSGGYAHYSGTTTYTTTNYITKSYYVKKFHQKAYFLAKEAPANEDD